MFKNILKKVMIPSSSSRFCGPRPFMLCTKMFKNFLDVQKSLVALKRIGDE